jgi:hypothetical protein
MSPHYLGTVRKHIYGRKERQNRFLPRSQGVSKVCQLSRCPWFDAELRRDIFARLPRTDMELLVEGCRHLREGDDGSHLRFVTHWCKIANYLRIWAAPRKLSANGSTLFANGESRPLMIWGWDGNLFTRSKMVAGSAADEASLVLALKHSSWTSSMTAATSVR